MPGASVNYIVAIKLADGAVSGRSLTADEEAKLNACVASATAGSIAWGPNLTSPGVQCSHIARYTNALATTDCGPPFDDGYTLAADPVIPAGASDVILLENTSSGVLGQISVAADAMTKQHEYSLSQYPQAHAAFISGTVFAVADIDTTSYIRTYNTTSHAQISASEITEPYGASTKDTCWATALSNMSNGAPLWGDLFYYLPQRDGRYTHA